MRTCNLGSLGRRSGLMVLAAVGATVPAVAFGQSWTGLAGDGLFSSGGNWDSSPSAPVSDVGTAITFGGTSGYAVTLDSLAPNGPFVVNSLTFNNSGATSLTGGTLSFDGAAPAIVQLGSGNATISSRVSIASALTLTGTGTGTVSLLGGVTGSATSSLTMAGASTLRIGTGTLGGLSVTSGAVSLAGGLVSLSNASTGTAIGSLSGPAASLSVLSGGTLAALGGLLVGNTDGSSGLFTVGAGGVVKGALGLVTGGGSNSYGDVSVTGTGATVAFTSSNVLIGNGTGAHSGLSIAGGAKVQQTSFYIAQGVGATATVFVGAGSTFASTGSTSTSATMSLGDFSSTGITVSGLMTAPGYFLTGYGTNSLVGVTVTGTGSKLTSGNYAAIGNATGASANILVSGGGSVSFGGTLYTSLVTNTATSITVTGAGSRLSATSCQLSGGNGGSVTGGTTNLSVNAGATFAMTGSLLLGYNSNGATVNATVSGTGSLLSTAGTFGMSVGTNDYAGLSVNSGSTLSWTGTSQMQCALYDSSVATIVVDNAKFTSTATGTVFLAGVASATNATANITVRNGGTFTMVRSGGTNSFQAATAVGSTFNLVADGGTFSDTGAATGAYFLGTALNSNVSVTAVHGGTAKFGSSTVFSSYVPGATTTITADTLGTVSFAGAQLFGWNGTGGGIVNINVSGGGLFSATNTTYLGASGVGSTATLNVSSGTYSGALLILGANGTTFGGQGIVNVGPGGAVGVSGFTTLGDDGTISMTGGTFATRALSNSGAPAFTGLVNLAAGSLTINGAGLTAATGYSTGAAFTGAAGSLILSSPFVTQNLYGTGGTFSGPITVSAGTLSFSSSSPVGAAHVSVAAGALLQFNVPGSASELTSEGTFASLNIAGSATAIANARPANLPTLLTTGSLSITGSGTLDLGSGDLILHSTLESVVDAYVASGALTASAGSVASHTGLAVIGNSDGMGGALHSTFDGVSVSATDVLVKFTWIGDTDENGVVNGDDLSNLLAGMAGGLTGYGNGDLNYDGIVDSADLSLLLASLEGQTGSFGNSSGPTGAVPEPSRMGLVAAAVSAVGRRRRR